MSVKAELLSREYRPKSYYDQTLNVVRASKTKKCVLREPKAYNRQECGTQMQLSIRSVSSWTKSHGKEGARWNMPLILCCLMNERE